MPETKTDTPITLSRFSQIKKNKYEIKADSLHVTKSRKFADNLTGKWQAPAGYHSDGADESKTLLGSNKTTNSDLYWYYNNNPVPGKAENISPELAIRSGEWKLLMDPDGSKQQLFNLQKDHRETTNLVGQEKKKAAELSAKLTKWYADVMKNTNK